MCKTKIVELTELTFEKKHNPDNMPICREIKELSVGLKVYGPCGIMKPINENDQQLSIITGSSRAKIVAHFIGGRGFRITKESSLKALIIN